MSYYLSNQQDSCTNIQLIQYFSSKQKQFWKLFSTKTPADLFPEKTYHQDCLAMKLKKAGFCYPTVFLLTDSEPNALSVPECSCLNASNPSSWTFCLAMSIGYRAREQKYINTCMLQLVGKNKNTSIFEWRILGVVRGPWSDLNN